MNTTESFQDLFTEYINTMKPNNSLLIKIANPEKHDVFSKGVGFQEIKKAFVDWYQEDEITCNFKDEWILNEIFGMWGCLNIENAEELEQTLSGFYASDYSDESVLEALENVTMNEINNHVKENTDGYLAPLFKVSFDALDYQNNLFEVETWIRAINPGTAIIETMKKWKNASGTMIAEKIDCGIN